MSIETLIATMHQKNLKLYKEMNINTDAVFANQTKKYNYEEEINNKHKIKMLSTNTKGVGINRNLALLLSTADICILGDDDIKYEKNYNEIIEKAFNEISDADIIIFNINTIGQKVNRRQNTKIKRVNILNFLNYGAVRIAFRRESIIRENIWFSTLFGGGTKYSSGEDTIFLRDALKKKLKIYTYPETIGTVDQTNSTWFDGYNEKFFYDKGALLCHIFPIAKYFIGLTYFTIKFKGEIKFFKKAKTIYAGIRNYKKNIDYEKWKKRDINYEKDN